MIWLLWGLLAIVVAEIGLVIVVRKARTSFPWVITEKDEVPRLDSAALEKFIATSFDPRLGWVRKPNSSGIERGKNGNIRFEIDASGSRATVPSTRVPTVAAFGDSYAFCRQVEDGETWEAHLARAKESTVLNYGVGNYGVDQALLRYEGMQLPDTVRIVVMGFVPETICRVHSYWKHYLEFGNTFAFKPRFVLGPGRQLSLLENVMQTAGDFADIRPVLPLVQKNDFFYFRKFKALQFRFPYLLRFVLRPRRQGKLLAAVALRGLLRLLSRSSEKSENLPFTRVMQENIRNAHSLYRDERAQALLREILLRFKAVARSRGHEPLILLMPQLLDIKLTESNPCPYEAFYRSIGEHVPVLDLTQVFNQHKTEDLYINDQYGGHLSSSGNLIVAQEIAAWMDTLNMDIQRDCK
jgi:hypothetical protein